MLQRFKHIFILIIFVLLAALSIPVSSKAESVSVPELADTAFDLVNAVNALRASNGLSPYSISSILMYTAQSQADFMAATGNVTHTGAGGSTVTSRILAAGYPLAGDLSLGGFRSENIIGGLENMSAQAAVNAWTGDAPHLTTMLSPNLTEIGAGVTVVGGRVYYVIDAALPTGGAAPQVAGTAIEGGPTVPVGEAVIRPVVVSTPNADGNVIHEVLAGQSLWQIAIDYEVKIDDIKQLNNLPDNNIYPGDKLLIKKNIVAPTASPAESPTLGVTRQPTYTSAPSLTPVQLVLTETHSLVSASTPKNNTFTVAVTGIIILALLGGGLFTYLGSVKKE